MAILTRRVNCADTFTYNRITKTVGGRDGAVIHAGRGYDLDAARTVAEELAWLVFEPVEAVFFEKNRIVAARLCFFPTTYMPPLPDGVWPQWSCCYPHNKPPAGASGNLDAYVDNAQLVYYGAEIAMNRYTSIATEFVVRLRAMLENSVFIGFNVMLESCRCPIASRHDAARAPYMEITYEDGAAFLPECAPVWPVFDVVDGNQDATFRWSYVHPYGFAQAGYALQYLAGGQWVTLAEQSLAKVEHVVPGGVLPSGQTQWRVRVQSSAGVWSAWQATTMVVKASPPRPDITELCAAPRAAIGWSTPQQAGWRVRVAGCDTGVVYGAQRRYVLPEELPDGEYIFRVGIVNNEGMWSEDAVLPFTVRNQPGEAIALTAAAHGCSVALAWETRGEYESYAILRGGVVIGHTGETCFEDIFCGRECSYVVRGALPGGYYMDSSPAVAGPEVENAAIGLAQAPEWVLLERRVGALPGHSEDAAAAVALCWYEGRQRPVAYGGGRVEKTHRIRFGCLHRGDYNKIAAMLGRMVVYKDCGGEVVCGVLTALQGEKGRGNDLALTIEEAGCDGLAG